MENQHFVIQDEKDCYFHGSILDGELRLTSELENGDWSSEQHIDFSKEDTERIFSLTTLEEFKELCAEKGLKGLYGFIEQHSLKPRVVTI